MEIAGSFDNNFKELEKVSGSKIYFRGILLQLRVINMRMKKLKNAIEYLIYRFRSDKK
jgi:hypothetical protein